MYFKIEENLIPLNKIRGVFFECTKWFIESFIPAEI